MQSLEETTSRRRDPAPSRWAYRLHRLWLTPSVRKLLRIGLPLSISFLAGSWVFNQPQNQAAIGDMVSEIRRSIAERPEFMVKLMSIEGADTELSADIREILPVDFPITSFDLDLEAMQDLIEELDAVAAVDLRIRPGGVLQLEVTARNPAVVWRAEGILEMLDQSGRRVSAVASRDARADLPLIAGIGADQAVAEALDLIAAASPISDRLRGLVRIGERRWDLVLDRNQRIMLPETEAVEALELVIALDQAQDMLGRDLSAVDMRNPNRPTVRLTQDAVDELHRIKGIELGNILQ